MKPRPVVTTARVTRADRYRACPTPDALTVAVGRDADPLREAYLRARRERERGMLEEGDE